MHHPSQYISVLPRHANTICCRAVAPAVNLFVKTLSSIFAAQQVHLRLHDKMIHKLSFGDKRWMNFSHIFIAPSIFQTCSRDGLWQNIIFSRFSALLTSTFFWSFSLSLSLPLMRTTPLL